MTGVALVAAKSCAEYSAGDSHEAHSAEPVREQDIKARNSGMVHGTGNPKLEELKALQRAARRPWAKAMEQLIVTVSEIGSE